MVSQTFLLKAVNGLNSKASAAIVAEANKHHCKLTLSYLNETADLKSIMNVMGLVIRQGETFSIQGEGTDEEAALKNLSHLMTHLHLI